MDLNLFLHFLINEKKLTPHSASQVIGFVSALLERHCDEGTPGHVLEEHIQTYATSTRSARRTAWRHYCAFKGVPAPEFEFKSPGIASSPGVAVAPQVAPRRLRPLPFALFWKLFFHLKPENMVSLVWTQIWPYKGRERWQFAIYTEPHLRKAPYNGTWWCHLTQAEMAILLAWAEMEKVTIAPMSYVFPGLAKVIDSWMEEMRAVPSDPQKGDEAMRFWKQFWEPIRYGTPERLEQGSPDQGVMQSWVDNMLAGRDAEKFAPREGLLDDGPDDTPGVGPLERMILRREKEKQEREAKKAQEQNWADPALDEE